MVRNQITSEVPTKQRLMKVAAQLMAEKGFKGVSVRQICKEAGVNSNAITYHFKSKENLLEELVSSYDEEIYKTPAKILEVEAKSSGEFELCLTLYFNTLIDAMLSNIDVLKLLIKGEASCKSNRVFSEAQRVLKTYIENGQKSGLVNPNLDPGFITGIFMDRIYIQVIHIDFIKEQVGSDIRDGDYRQNWVKNNLELFFNGLMLKNTN